MAIQFNEIDDHYEVATPAARNFPANDWVIALWTRIDKNLGSAYKYALSNGAWGDNGSVQIYLSESNAGFPNKWTVRVIDDTGNGAWIRSSSSPGADLKNRLILLQRNMSSNRLEFWFCEFGNEPVLEATADASSLVASTGPRDLWIGGRADGNPDRFFGGVLGEVFRGDFALSAEQIKALGMGHPAWALGRELDFYLPLSDARLVQRDHFRYNDAVATKPGVNSAHFPLATRVGSVSKWSPEKPLPVSDLLIDLSNVSTAQLPTWDDGQGTAYLEDGNGNKRAISWSSEGFTLVNNGAVTEQYPPAWSDPVQKPGGKTYHFSSSTGDNANDGLTAGSPKKDISELSGITLKPGDSVLLKRGDTWVGQGITTRNSGLAGNVIRYGAYGSGNVKPVLDGKGIQFVFYIKYNSHIWVDGLDFRNGAFDYPTSPYSGQVRVTGSKSAFITDITFTDCVIRESRCSGMSVSDPVDHITLKDCVFHGNPAWGLLFNSGDGSKLAGNVIRECVFYNNSWLKDPVGAGSPTEPCNGISGDTQVFGCYFHSNKTPDHWLYRGWNAPEKDEWKGLARIHDNLFEKAGGTASSNPIGVKGRGATVYRCKVVGHTQFAYAFTLPYAADGGEPRGIAYTHHCIATDIRGAYGAANEGYGASISSLAHSEPRPGDPEGEGEHYVWNNTFVDCRYGAHIDNTRNDSSDSVFHFVNNMVDTMDTGGARLQDTVFDMVFDYNFYSNINDTFHHVSGNGNFDYWRTTYGFDAKSTHGVDSQMIDPLNATPINRDFGLAPGSPARGAGTDEVYKVDDPNSWIGINYVPHATSPDAGAYQYLSAKTLDFSKYFVGLRCKNNLAQRFKLWRTPKDENSLRALTSA